MPSQLSEYLLRLFAKALPRYMRFLGLLYRLLSLHHLL
ncbi:hypothetical protein M770_13415 [Pseudomonas aeruginosa VRFPA03]|nr:hypothetical protein M770_13415 [Pseudomonas aeruginosa VRFPA03]